MIDKYFVIHCIAEAECCRSKINHQVIHIDGKCGLYVKHFLNNLCGVGLASHLELGTGTGASIISASFKNSGNFLTIDDWRRRATLKEEFIKNKRILSPFCNFVLLEEDLFNVNVSKLNKFKTLFWDGDHSQEGIFNSFLKYDPVFDEKFVFVLDDWNYPQTKNAVDFIKNTNKYNVLFEKIIETDFEDVLITGDHSTSTISTKDTIDPIDPNKQKFPWWNGIYIALMSKKICKIL